MRTFCLAMIAAVLACGTSVMAGDIAPGSTLRAAYLGTNPAQAMRDPATGEFRGPAYDLARELARRNNVPLEFKPIASPPAVIEAVKNGEADIGFVAYEATRLGTVEFSQTYMLVRQSFLVLDGSPIAHSPHRGDQHQRPHCSNVVAVLGAAVGAQPAVDAWHAVPVETVEIVAHRVKSVVVGERHHRGVDDRG